MKQCLICRKPVEPETKFYPFCSERCRLIDLGNWASEKYRISTPVTPDEEDQTEQGEDQPSD
ncbi:MAG TPA: DNA gyrase inhibitor YacG [Bryobacteraceae bacterium]|nr:DNA gyrase inhibitor YacG [Bryobacteraceae bacterium]